MCVCFSIFQGSDTEGDDNDDEEEDTPKKKTKKKAAKESSPSASSAKEKKSKSKGRKNALTVNIFLFLCCHYFTDSARKKDQVSLSTFYI